MKSRYQVRMNPMPAIGAQVPCPRCRHGRTVQLIAGLMILNCYDHIMILSPVGEVQNDPAAQPPDVLMRGVLHGDNDGHDYRRDTREGAAALALAKAYEILSRRVLDLEADRRRLQPVLDAFQEFNRGYTCPKCGHVLITEHHVEALKGT